MIKPIETVYNGYRFRSRLEARWAVFFDALGIDWEYEYEGFDLDGEWYLPDFFLPSSMFFVEVKPAQLNDRERRLLNKLDDNPPKWAMGAVSAIGVPETPTFHYERSPTDGKWYLVEWSGNTAFFIIQEGIARDSPRIQQAIDAAKFARFEHGEKPIIGGGSA